MTEQDKIIQDQRREIDALKSEIKELYRIIDQYEESMRSFLERLDAVNEHIRRTLDN